MKPFHIGALGLLLLWGGEEARAATIFVDNLDSYTVGAALPSSPWGYTGTQDPNGTGPGTVGNSSATVVNAAPPGGADSKSIWLFENAVAVGGVNPPDLSFDARPTGWTDNGTSAIQVSFDFQLQSLGTFLYGGTGHSAFALAGGFQINVGTGAQAGQEVVSAYGPTSGASGAPTWGNGSSAVLNTSEWYHVTVITPPSLSTGGFSEVTIADMNGNVIFSLFGQQNGPALSYNDIFFRAGLGAAGSYASSVYLSNFSIATTTSVPEPAVLVLAIAGGFLLFLIRRRVAV